MRVVRRARDEGQSEAHNDQSGAGELEASSCVGPGRGPGIETVYRSAVLGLLILAYAPVFRVYASQHWLPDRLQGVYTLGPFIVLCSLYLLWRQRRLLDHPTGEYWPAWASYPVLTLGVGLKVVADLEGFPVLRGLSLVPVLLGIFMVLAPKPAVRGFLFPTLYLLFAIPLPPFLLDEVTRPLLDLQAFAVPNLLPLLGIAVSKAGYVLSFSLPGGGSHAVHLVEGCSGIRSLVTLLSLVVLYTHLRGYKGRLAWGLAGLSVVLAGLANFLRIALTIFLIRHFGVSVGEKFFHDYSGIGIFLLTLLGIFGIESLWHSGGRRREA